MWFYAAQELFITDYAKITTQKHLYALLRAMHVFQIRTHMISRIVMFLDVFQNH